MKKILLYQSDAIYLPQKSGETKPASTAEQCHKFENLVTFSALLVRENSLKPLYEFFQNFL
jgi:hypothetical protein